MISAGNFFSPGATMSKLCYHGEEKHKHLQEDTAQDSVKLCLNVCSATFCHQ